LSKRLRHYIDLILVLTDKEMKLRYKSSILGYLWSIGHPLALALVFFVAFKVVMKIQMDNYALFLICGLFPWQWFQNSVTVSPTLFLNNASIIKKVNFPRNIIPFVSVLQDMIHFILSILVIAGFMLAYRKAPSVAWIYGIPVLLVIQFLTAYGASLFIASINLFFRDLERLTTIFMTLLFYFTPVIYPVSMVPDKYKFYVNLNPLGPLMISWRGLFLEGKLETQTVSIAMLYAVLFCALGSFVYKKLSVRFGEIL